MGRDRERGDHSEHSEQILLLGFGVTNQAVADALVRRGQAVVVCDDKPTDMSRASASRFPSMKSAVLQLDFTAPSCVQPDVPLVMPKVWLPNVPLVVTARTCGAMPACPSKSFEPQPQLPTLFSPAAIALSGNTAATATTPRSFFIASPIKCYVVSATCLRSPVLFF